MNIMDYVTIARPRHWAKNLLILPGTIVALALTNIPISQIAFLFFLGFVSVCLIASANYVLNEWVDAKSDLVHPLKKNRPAAAGNVKALWVYIEYAVLTVFGLGLASFISKWFLTTAIFFLIMGYLYNVRPFRTKEKAYLDVLSESINNPIRLLFGWFIVTSIVLPPSSFVLGYWMSGAFLMNVKRYAELRYIGDPDTAILYRRSFRSYTEKRLLILSFFYGMCSAFFLGVFLVKYRVELLLSLPFLAILFTWYLQIGMKPNSPVQNPERLFLEKKFLAYVLFLALMVSFLLFFDLPWMNWFLNTAFISIK